MSHRPQSSALAWIYDMAPAPSGCRSHAQWPRCRVVICPPWRTVAWTLPLAPQRGSSCAPRTTRTHCPRDRPNPSPTCWLRCLSRWRLSHRTQRLIERRGQFLSSLLGSADYPGAGCRAQKEPLRHVASLQDIRQQTHDGVAGPLRSTERQELGMRTHTRVLPPPRGRNQSPVRHLN